MVIEGECQLPARTYLCRRPSALSFAPLRAFSELIPTLSLSTYLIASYTTEGLSVLELVKCLQMIRSTRPISVQFVTTVVDDVSHFSVVCFSIKMIRFADLIVMTCWKWWIMVLTLELELEH